MWKGEKVGRPTEMLLLMWHHWSWAGPLMNILGITINPSALGQENLKELWEVLIAVLGSGLDKGKITIYQVH